jgi:hypothetical protein
MRYSVALATCAGATEADVARRAAAIGRDPAELRKNGAAGTAAETAAAVRTYIDAGADRVYFQILDLSDLDHLDFIANEVAPLLA